MEHGYQFAENIIRITLGGVRIASALNRGAR